MKNEIKNTNFQEVRDICKSLIMSASLGFWASANTSMSTFFVAASLFYAVDAAIAIYKKLEV